jgi:hypothetical protein
MVSLLSEVDHESLSAIQILIGRCAKYASGPSDISIKLFPPTSNPPFPNPPDCDSGWRLLVTADTTPVGPFDFVCASNVDRHSLRLLVRQGFAIDNGPILGGSAFIIAAAEVAEYLWPRLKAANIPLVVDD